MGPNFKRLVCMKASQIIIPKNCKIADAINSIIAPGRLQDATRVAYEWVRFAIDAVKKAPANPFGNDEEAIAGEILKRVAERTSKDAHNKN